MNHLEALGLARNQIWDLAPLANLRQLKKLSLSDMNHRQAGGMRPRTMSAVQIRSAILNHWLISPMLEELNLNFKTEVSDTHRPWHR